MTPTGTPQRAGRALDPAPAPNEPNTLVLVSTSARMLAESAVRGGYGVRVLDGFCDLDTQTLGPCRRVPLDLGAGLGLAPGPLLAALGELAAAEAGLGLVYGSGLESAAAVLSAAPAGLRLLGNGPGVLERIADPRAFLELLGGLAIDHPPSRLSPPDAADPGPWLLKCTGGSGGLGVTPWRPPADHGDPRPDRPHLFQRRLAGPPMSVLFIADGREARIIGYNRLLVADTDPAHPWLYGGALGPVSQPAPVRATVAGWCRALVGELGLRGLNNLDFILDRGRPWLVDLNPRPSATMALYEDACPGGWVARHVRACLGVPLDEIPPPDGRVRGHRIVWAPGDLEVPPDLAWPDWTRDRPAPGTAIPAGTPLCSVLAAAPDGAAVTALLAARAAAVEENFAASERQ